MFYTGCSYQGETTPDGKRFNNQGVYTFANGDTYVGAFKDGRMHGHGTLFFTAERGGGQYRGVWENGRNVSGAFVFSDGLVYGSEETGAVPTAPAATPAVKDGADETERKTNGRENLAEEWLYCREGDRRLWAEHLREVMPVLPLQAVLGGERVPQSSRWAAEPVVAPCVAAEAKIPATFVQGQPRCLSDVPPQFWEDPAQRETVVACMQLPTPPFKGAQGGAGREETIVDSGGRLAMNLSLRKIAPLESEAMRRAIAAAVSASAAASKVRSPLEELHKPSENTDPHSAPQLAAGASVEGQSTHVPESSEKETVPTNNDTQSNDERHSPEERASSPTVEDELYASLRKQQLEAEVKTNDDLTEHGEEQHTHSAAGEEERAFSPTVEDELYASLRKQQLEAEVKTNDDLTEHGEE